MGEMHDQEFAKIADNFAKFVFRSQPVMASFLGYHEFDELFTDYSPSGIKKRLVRLETFKKNFKSINKRTLSPDNKIDYDLAMGYIEAQFIFLKKTPMYQINPSIYLDDILYGIYVLIARDFAPVRERALSATRRLAQVGNVLKHARKNIKSAPPEFIEAAINTLSGTRAFLEKIVPGFAEEVLGALRDAMLEANDEAIEELEKFCEELENDFKKKAKGGFAVGKAVYNQLLRHLHQLSYSSDQLLKIAEDYQKELENELKTTAKQISPKKNWTEVVNSLKDKHPASQSLIATYKKEIKKARAFVLKNELVSIVEEGELEVVPTPKFAEAFIPYCDYIPPAPMEETKKGTFWVTTPTGMPPKEAKIRLRGHSKWAIPNIALHEAYPGRHTQLLQADKINSLIRHIASSPIFTEGWAFYCEVFMNEMGYVSNPRQRLIQLKDALWRVCRVLIDVGLQTKTMKTEEAIEMLIEKAGLERSNAEAEVRRYIQDPTQPMTYLIGMTEILALREDYKKEKGDEFSLKAFHDELLSHGSIPVDSIRKLMDL